MVAIPERRATMLSTLLVGQQQRAEVVIPRRSARQSTLRTGLRGARTAAVRARVEAEWRLFVSVLLGTRATAGRAAAPRANVEAEWRLFVSVLLGARATAGRAAAPRANVGAE